MKRNSPSYKLPWQMEEKDEKRERKSLCCINFSELLIIFEQVKSHFPHFFLVFICCHGLTSSFHACLSLHASDGGRREEKSLRQRAATLANSRSRTVCAICLWSESGRTRLMALNSYRLRGDSKRETFSAAEARASETFATTMSRSFITFPRLFPYLACSKLCQWQCLCNIVVRLRSLQFIDPQNIEKSFARLSL
jgi:hypothetical protein